MRNPRKNYTSVEKVAILRRHLFDHVPVFDLSNEHQLSPALFYSSGRGRSSRMARRLRKQAVPEGHLYETITALRDELQRKN